MAGAGAAHEVQPSVADVAVGPERATIRLVTAVEPLIAGVDLASVTNTNDSPMAGFVDTLRAMPPAELEAVLRDAWPALAERITLRAGDAAIVPVLDAVEVPPVGDVELRRDTALVLHADLPPGDDPLVFGWESGLGGLIVRQSVEGETYGVELTSGALSDPLPRAGVAELTLGGAVARYLVSGFDHIVPKGLDHILFVLGLYFYALAWRPLLWQVTAFTAAHTVTLALATLGVVSLPAAVVEPLIAASIVLVALENLRGGERRTIGWGRIAVVFGFGLLHGLGFASVLGEFGLGQHFAASLISFNVGVEIGQLAVIAVAFLLLGLPFGAKPWYRERIAVPGSLAIAAIGAYWVLNRVGVLPDVPLLT